MPMDADDTLNRLLDAALPHVAFDGWSEATFRAAIAESGIDPVLAKARCPRGAVDLAVAFHKRGDEAMMSRIRSEDMSALRIRERITAAVRYRLEAVEDKDAVRRGAALFALPPLAPQGARLIWGTADAIWTALGDTSEDINWYTKRATLCAVYSSTVLYWLGDESPDQQNTWAFLDRRIGDVMQFEKAKAQARENPVLSRLTAGPAAILGKVRAPTRMPRIDLPGHWTGSN